MALGNLITQVFLKKLRTEDNFDLSNDKRDYFSAAASLNRLFLDHFEESAFFQRTDDSLKYWFAEVT